MNKNSTLTISRYLTLTIFLSVTVFHPVFSQNALKATGGTGNFKGDIFWLNFSGVNLAQGQSLSRNFTVDGVQVMVTINSIAFSGEAAEPLNPSNLSGVRLIGYKPGDWSGDGLDNLYNIGGAETSNTLTNALCTNFNGNINNGGSALVSTFTLTSYATLNGQPVDLGMIFASAEDDGNGEYTKSTTNGSNWQMIESRIQTTAGYRSITFSNGSSTAQMQMGGSTDGFGSSDANVALLYTNKQATSALSPLTNNLTFSGRGKAAIAIGLFLKRDYGDAPVSYGTASNIFFNTVTGGTNNPLSNSIAYLSTGTNGGSPVITSGRFTDPQIIRLGTKASDSEGSYPTSSTGLSDDNDGNDDEDAYATNPPIDNSSSSTYSMSVPAFKNLTNASAPVYVMAWYDFNRNGSFEPAEYATTSFTTNNSATTVTLNWNLTGVPRATGATYARLRITTTNPATLTDNSSTTEDERSFVTVFNGETEDYFIPAPVAAPLPITLYSFTASNTNNCSVNLEWKTAIETTVSHIELERSNDGIQYQTIQNFLPKGVSSTYNAHDASPGTGKVFYRLKTTDLDGSITYSSIASVNLNCAPAINVYPNPAADYIILSNINGKAATVSLYDAAGKLYLQKYINQLQPQTKLSLNGVAAGMYNVVIVTDNSTHSIKLVKK